MNERKITFYATRLRSTRSKQTSKNSSIHIPNGDSDKKIYALNRDSDKISSNKYPKMRLENFFFYQLNLVLFCWERERERESDFLAFVHGRQQVLHSKTRR